MLASGRGLCLAAVIVTLASCKAGGQHKLAPSHPAPPDRLAELPLESFDYFVHPAKARPPDAADKLIARAEEEYAAGLADYRAGNFDKARVAFDQAVDILLESHLNVLGDQRLKSEFDKLVEDIHSLEVVAVERGDVLSEKKYEPAPMESFAGLTFPVNPKVREQVQEELKTVRSDLPLVSNDVVSGVIAFLQGRGSTFVKTALKRIGLYQPLFSEALKQQGLPQDLIYLAAAESAFNPFALSRAGAKGIWQLMLSRATEYGLKKDRWVDEREDPVKSTQAAVRHLKDLFQMFGDWYLAMAAYNCGPIAVQKAIERTGYADFWTLHRLHALPVDTENYVPVIIAMALIAKDPKAYGFDVEADPAITTDQVAVHTPIDLRLVAQLIDRAVEEVIRLNPGLQRWTTPANDPAYVLNLPSGTGPTFEAAIAAIPPDKRIWWRTHKVEPGDTIASVARKFRLSTVALAGANRLAPGEPLPEGTRLVLPLAPASESSLARVRERGPRRPIRYKVKTGDTLDRVADRFDVTPYQIRRWNRLSGSQLMEGQNLRIFVAAGAGAGRSVRRTPTRRPTTRASRSRTPVRPQAPAGKDSSRAQTEPPGASPPPRPASVASR